MTGAARSRLGPGAAQAFVAVFVASTAFPVAASLIPSSGISNALGLLDVIMAAGVVALGFALDSTAHDQVTDDDRRMAGVAAPVGVAIGRRDVACEPAVVKGHALLVVMMLAIAACGSAQTSVSGTSSPMPRDDCALTTEPGPADEPDRDGGDLVDLTDFGGGRWRLCLAEPLTATAEGTAWCMWTQDRTAVSEIGGHQARIGTLDHDAYLSIARNAFQLHTTEQGTTVGNYEPGGVVPVGEASEDKRSGNLTFDVMLVVDPETGAHPGAQPRYAGSMSWQCGDPPPPR